MAKRPATSDLNHDNWDIEDEPDDPGTFKTAAEDVLKRRAIKVARRRLRGPSSVESNKNIFSDFSGFAGGKGMKSAKEIAIGAENAFSFLSKTASDQKNDSNQDKSLKKEELSPSLNSNYLAKLRSLNEEVVAWINQHVKSQPCCILTPVFRDYETFLLDIQKEYNITSASSSNFSAKSDVPGKEKASASSSEVSPKLSFGVQESKEKDTVITSDPKSSPMTQPSFNFISMVPNKSNLFDNKETSSSVGNHSNSPVSNSNAPLSGFKFSSLQSNKPAIVSTANSIENAVNTSVPSFSFSGGSKPAFSFSGLNSKPANSTEANDATNDTEGEKDEEPPKNEFVAVKEEDAIFSTRVKVFVKKGGDFADHGVGNLFLKKTPSGKHQALVRADTSLGNIIFNVLLNKDIPCKRLGKNNVMLICLPTPDVNPPPVPVLLRVKTSADADTLFEKIESLL